MLKISCAKQSITPVGKFFPCHLAGQIIRQELATGVMDDIFAKVFVLKIDEETMIWVSLELGAVEGHASDDMIRTLHEKYNVPENHIYISFVHTHAAPECNDGLVLSDPSIPAVPGYMEWIEEQVYKAAEKCMEQPFTEVHAVFNTVHIDGCYSCRNGMEKPCDKDITRILFLDAQEKCAGALCCFACHSTVLGPQNLLISSDLAGYLSRGIGEKYNCECMILLGAAGDVSNRLYRQGNDRAELIRVGNAILDQLNAVDDWQPLNIPYLHISCFHFAEDYPVDYQKKAKQLKDAEEKLAGATTYDEKKVYTAAVAAGKRNLEHFSPVLHLEMNCYYLQMGELSIFTMPAELFSRFGIMIKQAMDNKCSIFWGYNYTLVGYLFDAQDAGKSGESATSDIPAGTTELIVGECIQYIKDHREKG
jgi:hypothetical protein